MVPQVGIKDCGHQELVLHSVYLLSFQGRQRMTLMFLFWGAQGCTCQNLEGLCSNQLASECLSWHWRTRTLQFDAVSRIAFDHCRRGCNVRVQASGTLTSSCSVRRPALYRFPT